MSRNKKHITMKPLYSKLSIIVIALIASMSTFASLMNPKFSLTNSEEEPQGNSSYLVLKYYNIPENKYELEFLSALLQNYNFANDDDLDKAIAEGHVFFVEHQDEILTAIKSQELLIFRENVQNFHARKREEMWGPILRALPNILSVATAAGIEAGLQQQQQYQKKVNRDKDIQTYIAQNSSSTSKQYTQNFGNTPVGTNTITQPRVTTSNGFDEPLPSAPVSKKSDEIVTPNAGERIIPGIFVYNSQQAVVRLKYYSGRITAYSTSKDALNREQWISFIQTILIQRWRYKMGT